MKKYILLCIAVLAMSSCDNNVAKYRPSQFPGEQSNFSYAIPCSDQSGSIIVRVRLNGGPQFQGTWDTGCQVPLKISMLEAASLLKDGTLSESDYCTKTPITSANGETNYYNVYKLSSISFTDDNGMEHQVKDVPAIIDDNIGTGILIGLPVMNELGYSCEVSPYENLIYVKE